MAVDSRLRLMRSLFDPFLMLWLFSGALGVSLAQSTFCETLARTGNCSFYPSCVERRVPCGPNGYALGYAGKYCIKFTENMDEFSEDVRSTATPYMRALLGSCTDPPIHTTTASWGVIFRQCRHCVSSAGRRLGSHDLHKTTVIVCELH